VSQFLLHFEGPTKEHFYKWHDGVLLVSYPEWFTQRTDAVPYFILSNLKPDPHRQVRVADWIKFMRLISDDQADWFAKVYGIDGISSFRAIILLMDGYPGLSGTNSVVLDQSVALWPCVSQVIRGANPNIPPRVRVEVVGNSTIVVKQFSEATGKWGVMNRIVVPLFHSSDETLQKVN